MLLVHAKASDLNQFVEENINKELQEVFFLMSSNPTLDVDLSDVEQKALHYLQHKISRNPDDLRSHVQRIELNIRLKYTDGVFGSILDLFIALSDKGIAIRRRMLSIARPQLSVIHRVFLSHSLKTGLSSKDIMPTTVCSALTAGHIGTQSLVVNGDSIKKEDVIDPLIVAQEHIDKVEIDAAREILELAVISQPWREELHSELLGIYRATQDSDGIQKMFSKLSESSIPDPALWEETMKNVLQPTESA